MTGVLATNERGDCGADCRSPGNLRQQHQIIDNVREPLIEKNSKKVSLITNLEWTQNKPTADKGFLDLIYSICSLIYLPSNQGDYGLLATSWETMVSWQPFGNNKSHVLPFFSDKFEHTHIMHWQKFILKR